jgi:transposase
MKLLVFTSHCVIEATGYYQYQLAKFLCKENVLVSVVNPFSVKRFIQIKLAKVKQIRVMPKLFVNMVKLIKCLYILH